MTVCRMKHRRPVASVACDAYFSCVLSYESACQAVTLVATVKIFHRKSAVLAHLCDGLSQHFDSKSPAQWFWLATLLVFRLA